MTGRTVKRNETEVKGDEKMGRVDVAEVKEKYMERTAIRKH